MSKEQGTWASGGHQPPGPDGYRGAAAPRTPIIILCLCSLFFVPCSLARAALDPEIDKPYQLQVVLRIAENRLLTARFPGHVSAGAPGQPAGRPR